MRLFQNNCFQTLYGKSNKQLLATFVELCAHSSLSAESQQKSNESYPCNFLKVIALKCCTKAAMNSIFRRKPCTLLTISRKSAKMRYLSEFFQMVIKFITEAFPRYYYFKALYKYSNEQLLSLKLLLLNFLSTKSQGKCNAQVSCSKYW